MTIRTPSLRSCTKPDVEQALGALAKEAQFNVSPPQTVRVAKIGGDFKTIEDANDSITDASAAKPYSIVVYTGIFPENPIVMKEYVSIVAEGTPMVTANDGANPLFTVADNTTLRGLTIVGPAASSAVYAANGVTSAFVREVGVITALVAFHSTGVGTVFLTEDGKALTPGVGTCLLAEDFGQLATNRTLSSAANAFVSRTNGILRIGNSAVVGGATGIFADDDGTVFCVGIEFEGLTDSAVRTGPNGNNQIVGSGITCFTNNLDVRQDAAGSEIELASCFMDADKFDVQEHTEITITFDGQEQGRFLQTLTKDLSVGVPQLGRHTYMGEGEPYTRGMVVITTDDTAGPGSDGGNLTDVSAEARSISGSTFTFQGTAADHTILIGSSLEDGDVQKHLGIWLNQVTGAVEVTPKSFAIEIWNGAAWIEVASMAISPPEYYSYSNSLFLRSNNEEFVHFGIESDTTWAKKTISGQNLYWSRIRITANLTTAPVFDQFRLLPNHTTVHEDGTVTHHGSSRFEVDLVGLGNIFGESGGVSGATFNVGAGGVPTGWPHTIKNSLLNGNADAIMWQFPLPAGIDTSLPLYMEMTVMPIVGGADDVDVTASLMPLEVAGRLVADPAGGRVPVARTLPNTETTTAKVAQTGSTTYPSGTTDKAQLLTFGPFDVSDYYAKDLVLMRFEMVDEGTGLADTAVLTAEVSGSKWHLGQKN